MVLAFSRKFDRWGLRISCTMLLSLSCYLLYWVVDVGSDFDRRRRMAMGSFSGYAEAIAKGVRWGFLP